MAITIVGILFPQKVMPEKVYIFTGGSTYTTIDSRIAMIIVKDCRRMRRFSK